jgi:hypothetical protein
MIVQFELSLAPLARAAVSAEVPARPDRSVEAVRPGGAEVQARSPRPDGILVLAEPVHLVLRHADFEIFRQFEANSDGAFERNPGHRRGVLELRHVIPEGKVGREEQEQVARQCFPEWLDFQGGWHTLSLFFVDMSSLLNNTTPVRSR